MANHTTRTYRLDDGVVARLTVVAASYQVNTSSLVSVLLEAALDDLDAGRLRLDTRPVRAELRGVQRLGG